MKKNILKPLLAIACLLCSIGVYAQQIQMQQTYHSKSPETTANETLSMEYGYCGTMTNEIGWGVAGTIRAVIEVPQEVSAKFQGTQITHVLAGIGNNGGSNSKIIIMRTLEDSELLYSQSINLTAREWNKVEMETPFTIDGESFYIGYETTVKSATSRPIGIDSEEPNPHGGICALYDTESGKWLWTHLSEHNFGNNCIKVVLSGDNFPRYDMALQYAKIKEVVKTGKPFSISATAKNLAALEVKSFEVSYKIGDNEAVVVPFTANIASGEATTFTIDNITIEQDGTYDFTLEIVSVNGNADEDNSDNILTYTVNSMSNIVPRKILLEAFIPENSYSYNLQNIMNDLSYYNDIICVGHHVGYSSDQLAIQKSEPYLWFYGNDGIYVPGTMLDRRCLKELKAQGSSNTTKVPVFFHENKQKMIEYINYCFDQPAFVTVNIENTYNPETRELTIRVYGESVIELDQTPFLNIFLTESGIAHSPSNVIGPEYNYEHNNVIRDILTNTWGDELEMTNKQYDATYKYTLDQNWTPENIEIVAFVSNYDTRDVNNCVVYNAESIPIIMSVGKRFKVDNIYYEVVGEEKVAVSNSHQYQGSIAIPETVFYKGSSYNVTSISDEAFKACDALTEVTIPNSVTSIGDYAFYACINLTKATIGKSVTSIGEEAFSNCNGLTQIYCQATTPPTISSKTFSNYSATLYVPVESMDAYKTADYWKEFTHINTYFVDGLYYNILSTSDVEVTYKDDNYNSYSGEINIPETVEIEGVTFNVTSIGREAFRDCTGLTEVTIPNSVTSIGSYAFSGCTGLKEVTIPNSVTSIDEYAFYNCEALRTVTIGSGVTEIGDYAFDKCDRIKEVYAHPTVPPVIGSHTFTVYVNDNATLYLYKESQEAYAKADYWEYFVKIGTIKKEYTLTYMVDDTLYAQEYYFEGDTITPIAEPVKENYIFSGWSEMPEIMPAHDVTVTGSFTFNNVIDDSVVSYNLQEAISLDELIYIRNFDNTDWQAWYVPFEVDYTTIAYDFEVACINNVHQYDQNNDGEMDLTELEAVKMQEGVLKANYPYIVKAHSTGVKQVILNNATLQPTEVCSIDCSSVSLRYTFTGTYNAMTGSELMQNGCYALQYNMLEAPTEESALGAFRWYMQIEQRSGDNNAVPQCIVLKVKEDFTDIENVVNNTDNAPAEYYDLSGRRVIEPTSGIYIVKQGNTVRKVVVNER